METLILLILGILGVVAHSLIKANSLQKDATVANIKFTLFDYLNCDWLGISASFIMVLIWILVFGEVGAKYPQILDYVRLSFAGMGFFGSYILQTIFSKGKKYIRTVVDEKTNIADKLKE